MKKRKFQRHEKCLKNFESSENATTHDFVVQKSIILKSWNLKMYENFILSTIIPSKLSKNLIIPNVSRKTGAFWTRVSKTNFIGREWKRRKFCGFANYRSNIFRKPKPLTFSLWFCFALWFEVHWSLWSGWRL